MTTANPNSRVFWAGLLLILVAFTATAQEFRGLVAGKITDPNGAVVPGSKVEIKNVETGIGADVASSDAPIIGLLRKNSKFVRVVFVIQRELPGQIVVEANFIRANGYDLPVSRNLNFVPRQFLGDNPTTDAAASTFLTATIPNPFRNLVPGGRRRSRVRSRCFSFHSSLISGSRNTTAAIVTRRFSCKSTSASRQV